MKSTLLSVLAKEELKPFLKIQNGLDTTLNWSWFSRIFFDEIDAQISV